MRTQVQFQSSNTSETLPALIACVRFHDTFLCAASLLVLLQFTLCKIGFSTKQAHMILHINVFFLVYS